MITLTIINREEIEVHPWAKSVVGFDPSGAGAYSLIHSPSSNKAFLPIGKTSMLTATSSRAIGPKGTFVPPNHVVTTVNVDGAGSVIIGATLEHKDASIGTVGRIVAIAPDPNSGKRNIPFGGDADYVFRRDLEAVNQIHDPVYYHIWATGADADYNNHIILLSDFDKLGQDRIIQAYKYVLNYAPNLARHIDPRWTTNPFYVGGMWMALASGVPVVPSSQPVKHMPTPSQTRGLHQAVTAAPAAVQATPKPKKRGKRNKKPSVIDGEKRFSYGGEYYKTPDGMEKYELMAGILLFHNEDGRRLFLAEALMESGEQISPQMAVLIELQEKRLREVAAMHKIMLASFRYTSNNKPD